MENKKQRVDTWYIDQPKSLPLPLVYPNKQQSYTQQTIHKDDVTRHKGELK